MASTSPRRFVIIGNGIAGTTAAEQIRKADADASIILITNEPYSLYNRIALPPFLKHKIAQQKVTIKTVAWHQERNIDLRLETVVSCVTPESGEVHLESGEALPYDALLIATGGRANPLPGGDSLEHVYNFQSFDDAMAIDAQIARCQHAVTIGGSYIAYELTEAFRARGLETTWLMRGPYFLRRILDDGGGALVDAIAGKHGVRVVHGVEIAEVRGANGKVCEVVATDGAVHPCELLGVGVGITRNADFLEGSGIEIKQGVLVDDTLRSNVPNVYAAGDVAEYFDPYVGTHTLMGTWDNATNQGKVVAANMLGVPTPYDEVPTYSTTLFDNRIMAFGVTPEVDSEVGAVVWIDPAAENYRRLFFQGPHLVGGVIIGQRKGFPKLIDLIRTRTPIEVEDRPKLLEIQ
jgi:NAD(P)H-nitrite reductase large subunit